MSNPEELKKKQDEAVAEIERKAAEEAKANEALNQAELANLDASQKAEADALSSYNQSQFNNLGEIVSLAQAKRDAAQLKDETARRRENAFRYISGLGDTLSGVANLIGTANDAANQKQTYNSSAVVQKAEAERKARKLEMDDLSKRLDELKARQRDLHAAGSLKEAELKVKQDKERAALVASQRKAADEAKKYADTQAYRAKRDATEDWQKDRVFNAQQAQFNKTFNLKLREFNHKTDGDDYNFTFADGSIDIPKKKINDANIERIFQMIPDEVRATVKGEQTTIYETDEYGNSVRKTGNKAPTLNQKLAAIATYAESDENIKNELRKLAGQSPVATAEPEETPASTTDWGAYKVGGNTPVATAEPFYMNETQKNRAIRKEQRKEDRKNARSANTQYLASVYLNK